jgi:hypothetical protein
MGFVTVPILMNGLVDVAGLGIDNRDDALRGGLSGYSPRPLALSGFDVLARHQTQKAHGVGGLSIQDGALQGGDEG